MIMRKMLPRRTFLQGMGTAIALPFLDAMVPALARERQLDGRFGRGTHPFADDFEQATLEPRRVAFVVALGRRRPQAWRIEEPRQRDH